MNRQTVYSINGDDFSNLLKELKLKEEEAVIDKYYSVLVSTAWVAAIHEVDPSTVCRYVQRGLISTAERTSSKGNYKFRLSEVLRLDFNQLRKLI